METKGIGNYKGTKSMTIENSKGNELFCDGVWKVKDSAPKMTIEVKDEPDFNMTFHNPKGEIIGKIFIENDTMKFEGEADESAKVFFDNVIKQYLTKKQ